MLIFDKPKPEYIEDNGFSWISPNIYTAILIEDLCDSEYSVLKILHEYFRLHPDEYFYSEEDWFYTMEDIEKIYEKMIGITGAIKSLHNSNDPLYKAVVNFHSRFLFDGHFPL